MTMTGISDRVGCSRNLRVNSAPSMDGILKSVTTRSGVWAFSHSSASSGSANARTVAPSSIEAASLEKILRLVARSSRITMSDMGGFQAPVRAREIDGECVPAGRYVRGNFYAKRLKKMDRLLPKIFTISYLTNPLTRGSLWSTGGGEGHG